MTNYIHAEGSTILAYPYGRAQLVADNPNVSFPFEPTAEDLAPFSVFLVALSPRPADSRDLRADEALPVLAGDGWQQVWAVRPATADEITHWDLANAPAPDWMAFGIDLASHPGIAALYAAIPGPVANGLSIGLNEAGKGDPRLFSGLWQRVMAAGAITPELLADIAGLAVQHHLPAPFIAGLAPAAPERERARDEQGRFIEDDPATPDVDEAWQ